MAFVPIPEATFPLILAPIFEVIPFVVLDDALFTSLLIPLNPFTAIPIGVIPNAFLTPFLSLLPKLIPLVSVLGTFPPKARVLAFNAAIKLLIAPFKFPLLPSALFFSHLPWKSNTLPTLLFWPVALLPNKKSFPFPNISFSPVFLLPKIKFLACLPLSKAYPPKNLPALEPAIAPIPPPIIVPAAVPIGPPTAVPAIAPSFAPAAAPANVPAVPPIAFDLPLVVFAFLYWTAPSAKVRAVPTPATPRNPLPNLVALVNTSPNLAFLPVTALIDLALVVAAAASWPILFKPLAFSAPVFIVFLNPSFTFTILEGLLVLSVTILYFPLVASEALIRPFPSRV